MSRSRYSIIPSAAVRDKDLTELQFRCLCLIGTYLGEDHSAFPRQTTLASDLEVSRETINRAIRVLKDKGYIQAFNRHRDDGSQASSLYKIILDMPEKGCDPRVTRDPSVTGGVTSKEITGGVTPRGSHHEDTQDKIPKEDSREEREVFEFYNRKASQVGWTRHQKLSDAIRKPLKARIREYGPKNVCLFIDALAKQEWTFAGFPGNPEFRMSLMWACQPSAFAKHFDKLVPAQTEQDLLTTDASGPAFGSLEYHFAYWAKHRAWRGRADSFLLEPDDPDAKYPAALYAKYGLKAPEGAR